jgi:hypothetical protein
MRSIVVTAEISKEIRLMVSLFEERFINTWVYLSLGEWNELPNLSSNLKPNPSPRPGTKDGVEIDQGA